MTFDDYKAISAVNWSTLKHAGKSPAHYRAALERDFVPSPAMEIGTAVHAAVLEPEEFEARYVVWDGGARRGKAWDAFRDANADRRILKADEHQRVLVIAETVHSNRVAAPYLTGGGEFEASFVWTDEETGLRCKGRADRIAYNAGGLRVLVDLKTTNDGDPRKFAATAARLGYHGQLAFYSDGLASRGQPVDKVVMIVVETSAPFDVTVYEVDDETLYAGECLYRELLAKVAGCRSTGKWPGRFLAEEVFRLPAWAFKSDDDVDGFGLEGV